MLDKIITYSFYALFFLTPLFWTSLNYELFEYNKMILTYSFTVIIVGAWLLKTINDKRLTINRTPLDIPLLLFLLANILSTIFSIDRHTSIWGYYSRSNGGLLSIISYLLLYWAFVSNMQWPQVKNILKVGLTSGFIISLWAVLEHFGVSPSCVILRGEFNASCWVQDVQARVFATLGQPNWLASYLAMLIFPALYFLLTSTKKAALTTYYLLLTTYYLAFTFTYSRGPTLGLIVGMAVFILMFIFCHPEGKARRISELVSDPRIRERFFASLRMTQLFTILVSFLAINILFGSALTSFRLVSKFAPPPRPGIITTSSTTQLEQGGTESGQIRLIVWKGALDIFRHYPLFGSGVETFAYSYYQFRPASHNSTSEWDFLYNKAHNEYLNYLATTGIVGFAAYLAVIVIFVVWCVKRILESSRKSQESRNTYLDSRLLILVTLSSYVSYLVSNFFLFSVVIIAIFFYLFPALAFVATETAQSFKLPSILNSQLSIVNWLYRRPFYTQAVKGIVIIFTLYLLFSTLQLWYADTLFSQGQRAADAGNPGRAYNLLTQAVELNGREPFYRSELGYAAASAATALQDSEATLSASLKDEAEQNTEFVLKNSPNNVSYWRAAIRTYFELSAIDKKYTDKTLKALDRAITLAPTDPKLYYNKALILDSMGKRQEAVKVLQKALELKPDYNEAKKQLKEATTSSKP